MAPAEPAQRILFLHLLRMVGASLVLWAHLGPYYLAEADRSWVGLDVWRALVAKPLHTYQDMGHLGVVLFFFVSGYVITHTSLRETRTAFAVKRAFRLYPMILVALLVAAAARAITQTAGLPGITGSEAGGLLDHVRAFFLVNWLTSAPYVMVPLWTLAVEVMFYVLTWAFMRRTAVSPLRATWLMAGVWLGASMVLQAVPLDVDDRNVYVGLLLLGRVVYLVQTGRVALVDGACLGATVTALFLMLHTAAFRGQMLTPDYEPLWAWVLGFLAFVSLSRAPLTRLPRWVSAIADMSYSVYLLHIPVGMLVLTVLVPSGVPFTVALVVAIAAVLAMSWLTYRTVERPSQHLARALLRGQQGRRGPGGGDGDAVAPAASTGTHRASYAPHDVAHVPAERGPAGLHLTDQA